MHNSVIRALLALTTSWNILGKPKVHLDWRAAHAFCVDADGEITPDRLNLPLIDARP
jgi:hypothetical protein